MASETKGKIKVGILNSHPIQYFAPFYRELTNQNNIDLTVYYCSEKGLDRYYDPGFQSVVKWDTDLLDGYRSVFLSNFRRTTDSFGFFSLINIAIVSELIKNRYDILVVHGHNFFTMVIAVVIANFLGTKILMRGDSNINNIFAKTKFKRRLRFLLVTLYYHVFCHGFLYIGKKNKLYYHYHRIKNKQLFWCPLSVDNDRFIKQAAIFSKKKRKIQAEYGIRQDSIILLYAGKLMSLKRVQDLLLAYERLKNVDPFIALVLVGNGEDEKKLKGIVKQNKIKDVCFLPFHNQSKMPQIYAIGDVFIMPSESEQWGLALNEAMCSGLPVIASNAVGAAADLVRHGKNGFVFKVRDIDNLTKRLFEISEMLKSEKEPGKESIKIIQNWSYKTSSRGLYRAVKYLMS
jgi:glycosyltransferase involved in cell wall biosynthesis